jgi:AraC-like DNA-binding protein
MSQMTGTHGILHPLGASGQFALTRNPPPPDLAPFVERSWCVRWDLRGRPPFAQETLPWPCVNLVIGTHRPGVFGPQTARFVAHLDGEGWVVGMKFRAGGFRPFVTFPIAELADRELAIEALFGPRGAELDRAVHAAGSDERVALVEAFLRERAPSADEESLAASRIVELVRSEPTMVRVDALAARADTTVRALQRLFHEYVGLSPKRVIRRFRLHEAAERLAAGGVDAAELALECGYCDQSHFIRDFKSQIGRTPSDYAAHCARIRTP